MYLGIDIGTSSLKAVLVDADQKIVASKTTTLDVSRPHPGWSEQDPDSWWDACEAVLDALASDHAGTLAATKGIGLSGHMHGATLLDDADQPLRPCILWNDGRSAAEAAEISSAAERITGNIAMPGFTAPKLMWVKRHEPEIFARTRTVLLPKDYVRLKLSGDKASDMSDSAGTLWLDMAARAWSDEMLSLTGMDISQMPALFEGSAATGTLRPELAGRWGMSGPVVIAGGGGDNAASACGVGAVAAGT
ncbi:MAG: xylulokinase, partial [Hyphomicrobiales bacterium]|nr:xylulokinase [Hyphomicrobiales bacterium]